MKKCTAFILALLLMGTLAACGNNDSENRIVRRDTTAETSGAADETEESSPVQYETGSENVIQIDGKALVVYFAYS